MAKEMRLTAVIGVVVLVAIIGAGTFIYMRNRGGMSSFMKMATGGQITILNDSADTMSVEYKLHDKDVAMSLPPREKITCDASGLLRVFTADKAGSYELVYPVDNVVREVKVTEITAAGKKKEVEGSVYTEKGMIGDIKVMYEEPSEED